MKQSLWFLVIVIGLSGCATSLDGDRYRSIDPTFDLFQFFDGEVKAWGLVQNRSGEVVQKFEVVIKGTITGNQIILDETFDYAVGTGPAKRIWRIKRLESGKYMGTADDIIGEASGSDFGSAFHWSYRMNIPVQDTVYEVTFEDWFWAIDERRLFNRSYLQKFGFDVAEVSIFMERQ